MDFLLQKDEIQVLESIFTHEELPVLVLEYRSEHIVKFNAFQTAPQPITLLFKELESDNACGGTEVDQNMLSVSHLPPIELNVLLPKDYPSKSPPCYSISCMWLSSEHLQLICKHLDSMWRENHEVLLQWCVFLKYDVLSEIAGNFQYTVKSQEIVEELEVNESETSNKKKQDESSLDDSKITKSSENFNENFIREHLESYNVGRKLAVFINESFKCLICFEIKAGLQCVRLEPCRHVYCRDCIRTYLQTWIAEGSAYMITCPARYGSRSLSGCESEVLLHSQVGEIVSKDELFDKYDQVLLNSMLEMEENMIRCPRRDCLHPVIKDPEEKLAVCPGCNYAFCVQCNKGYHGAKDCHTQHNEQEALVEEYMNANSQMDEEKRKINLLHLEQTSLNEKWIEENAKRCPKCRVPIEKSDGCNKIVCNLCRAYFCWTCLAQLDVDCPYSHYFNERSPCYDMLLDGVPPIVVYDDDGDDDDDDDVDFNEE